MKKKLANEEPVLVEGRFITVLWELASYEQQILLFDLKRDGKIKRFLLKPGYYRISVANDYFERSYDVEFRTGHKYIVKKFTKMDPISTYSKLWIEDKDSGELVAGDNGL